MCRPPKNGQPNAEPRNRWLAVRLFWEPYLRKLMGAGPALQHIWLLQLATVIFETNVRLLAVQVVGGRQRDCTILKQYVCGGADSAGVMNGRGSQPLQAHHAAYPVYLLWLVLLAHDAAAAAATAGAATDAAAAAARAGAEAAAAVVGCTLMMDGMLPATLGSRWGIPGKSVARGVPTAICQSALAGNALPVLATGRSPLATLLWPSVTMVWCAPARFWVAWMYVLVIPSVPEKHLDVGEWLRRCMAGRIGE